MTFVYDHPNCKSIQRTEHTLCFRYEATPEIDRNTSDNDLDHIQILFSLDVTLDARVPYRGRDSLEVFARVAARAFSARYIGCVTHGDHKR